MVVSGYIDISAWKQEDPKDNNINKSYKVLSLIYYVHMPLEIFIMVILMLVYHFTRKSQH